MEIGIIVPAYNEKDNLAELHRQISAALKAAKVEKYNILIVNDGSTDGSLEEIKRLAKSDGHLRYLSFSRNFGHQAALRAGLAKSRGDAIISMDADLQHPPRLLSELIQHWRDGYDIVYTRRQSTSQTGLFKRLNSRLYYWLLRRLSGLSIDDGAADFRLIDARVAKVVNDLPEANLFLRGFISWAGFKVHAVDYVPDARFSGKTKYSSRKMMALAIQGITQFSIKPLRLASFLGLFAAFIGVVYGIYATWKHITSNATISGWTSVVVAVLILGGIQLIVLGVMGEYLGRTFMQTKQRPDYIISEEG